MKRKKSKGVFFMSWFYTKDATLYYEERGKGIPLVFIHPPVLTGKIFKYQLEELGEKFRVIAPDLRGHGNSEASGRPFSYSLIVHDLKALLKHLHIERAFICGYSTGGSIALKFMLEEPEKVMGGILLGGISEVMEKDFRLQKFISIGAKAAQLGAKAPLTFAMCYSNSNNYSYFKELFAETKKGSVKKMQEYFTCSLRFNITKELLNIHAPVLLLYGEKDKDFIPYGRLIHKFLPNSTFQYISKTRHQIPTKNPREVNKRIAEFIKIVHFGEI